MSKYDDLYTSANTKPLWGRTLKVDHPKHEKYDKDYIKNHIEVIAPVQYTNKLPTEAMIVVYAIMIIVLLSATYDGYCVIKHIYLGIKNWLTGKDASCIM